MKLTKKILLAFAAVIASALQAQTSSGASPTPAATPVTTQTPVGVLGQNYVDANFGFQDVKHTDRDAYQLSLSGNQAVAPNFDARFSYAYGWLQHSPKGHSNALNASATAYTVFSGMKPFVTGQLGYEWDNVAGLKDNFGTWAAQVGLEMPVGAISISPAIGYEDDMLSASRSTQEVTYGASANYWVSATSAVYAGVDYADVRKSEFDRWNYNVGLRLKF